MKKSTILKMYEKTNLRALALSKQNLEANAVINRLETQLADLKQQRFIIIGFDKLGSVTFKAPISKASQPQHISYLQQFDVVTFLVEPAPRYAE